MPNPRRSSACDSGMRMLRPRALIKVLASQSAENEERPDGLTAEHLKASGETSVIWLMNILNAVVELEEIPDILKMGVVVPV